MSKADKQWGWLLIGLLAGMIIGVLTWPEEAWAAETDLKPISVTAYYSENPTGCRGDRMREGIAAGKQEWYGMAIILYTDEGGQPGELIGVYEILDTGYGKRPVHGQIRRKLFIEKAAMAGTIAASVVMLQALTAYT